MNSTHRKWGKKARKNRKCCILGRGNEDEKGGKNISIRDLLPKIDTHPEGIDDGGGSRRRGPGYPLRQESGLKKKTLLATRRC